MRKLKQNTSVFLHTPTPGGGEEWTIPPPPPATVKGHNTSLLLARVKGHNTSPLDNTSPPPRTMHRRALCILLECIFVILTFGLLLKPPQPSIGLFLSAVGVELDVKMREKESEMLENTHLCIKNPNFSR